MRWLGRLEAGILAGGILLAVAGAAHGQNNQQQSDGNGGTVPTQTNNKPYVPPSVPSVDAGAGVARGGGGFGVGQSGSGGGMGSQNGGTGHNSAGLNADEPPQNQQQLEQQQLRARNAERQRQLVADTQRLVALANELETEVNSSTKDMLSLDVVRKADEIDKLARTVRDRMKNAN